MYVCVCVRAYVQACVWQFMWALHKLYKPLLFKECALFGENIMHTSMCQAIPGVPPLCSYIRNYGI